MDDTFCTDCKRYTDVVIDHAAGDTVCCECGLVLESRSIDETSEWRTFADELGDHDPVRVGSPANPLLGDSGLSTVISEGTNGSNKCTSLARVQNRGGDPDRAIVLAFKTIADMADRLSLVASIKDRASEIDKRFEDQKFTRGRKLDALVAACIFIACRQEGKARTVKEKEIFRHKKFIVKKLKVEMGESIETGRINAGDYLRRFCSILGLSNEEIKAVQETVQKSEELDIRRSPTSIAAAVNCMVSQLSDSKKTLRDISLVTTVAEATIKRVYKELLPHASRIISIVKDRNDVEV